MESLDREMFNSTNLTSNVSSPADDHKDPLASLTFVIIYSIASIVGAVGNLLVIIVYTKKRDRKSSTFYILVLAFIDFIACTALMPLDITRKRWLWDEKVLRGIPHTIFLWLRNMSLELQVVVLVAIAFDRFFAICRPLSFTMTWKRALHVTIISTSVLILLELGNSCTRMLYDGYYPLVDKFIKFAYMGGIVVALIIMAGLYIKIYVVVVQRTSKKKKKKVGPEKSSYSCSEPDMDSTHSNLQLNETTSSYQGSPNCTFRGEITTDLPSCSPQTRPKSSYNFPTSPFKNSNISIIESDLKKGATPAPPMNGRRTVAEPGRNGRYAKISTILASLPRRSLGAITFHSKQSSRRNHIKTAKMLFLVTLVFVLSWLPPTLINLKAFSYSSLVFCLFYVNNVANPIIYSFLNKRFRDDVKRLFKRMRR